MNRINAKIQNAELTVNIVDVFSNMDDESKKEIVELFAWHSPIWEEIKDGVNNEYAAEHFNDAIYRLRLSFLKSEDASDAIRQTITSLLNCLKQARLDSERYEGLDRKWRDWYRKFAGYEFDGIYPVKFEFAVREYLTLSEMNDMLVKLGMTKDVLNHPYKGDKNEN